MLTAYSCTPSPRFTICIAQRLWTYLAPVTVAVRLLVPVSGGVLELVAVVVAVLDAVLVFEPVELGVCV